MKIPKVKKVRFAIDQETQWESHVAIQLSEPSFYDADVQFEPA